MHIVERAVFFKRLVPLLMQWGATLYSVCISLGLSVAFARTMGPSDFGTYTYIYVLATFLVLAQDGGFNTLLMRERAVPSAELSSRSGELPVVALRHLLIMTVLFVVIAALLSPWLESLALACAVLCFASITLTQWQSSWFKGAGDFKRDALFLFCGRSVSALLVLIAVLFMKATPVAIFIMWGAGLLLTLACFYKHFPPLPRFKWHLPVWAYRSSVSFFAVGLASALYHQIDIVILRHSLGDAPSIGHYAVASRMYDGVLMLAWTVALMVFRRMRELAMTPEGGRGFGVASVQIAFAMGVVIAAGGWMFGPWIIGLLFGSAYSDGAREVVGWIFTALMFALPNSILAQSAIAHQRERWYAGCLAFTVIVSVSGNLFLVSLYGVKGAAWATVITEAALFISLFWGLKDELISDVKMIRVRHARH